ncbi:hypothetical protein SLEP1_g4970 [Rubroshorea leprosula]|uniref:Uncharacterized protein n=1 Tax=Rubroshorea leprosula TaxID=152421 RepID=A0AAV5I0X9_9ROSI|nr:hypothetical protein SLEP1_g4970 [Rubroshorea leprosula]
MVMMQIMKSLLLLLLDPVLRGKRGRLVMAVELNQR